MVSDEMDMELIEYEADRVLRGIRSLPQSPFKKHKKKNLGEYLLLTSNIRLDKLLACDSLL